MTSEKENKKKWPKFCNRKDVKCYELNDDSGNIIAYSDGPKGMRNVRIYNSNMERIATDRISAKAFNLVALGKNHKFHVKDGHVYVRLKNLREDAGTIVRTSTTYEADINGTKIKLIVVAGVIIGIVVAGVVLYIYKNLPAAAKTGTTAAIDTAKVIGGVEGAKQVKHLLNIISFSDNTYKKFIALLTAAALQNKASSQENSYNTKQTAHTLPSAPILLDLRDNNIKIKQNKKHQKTNNKINSGNQGVEKRYNDVLRGSVEYIDNKNIINPIWNKTIDEIIPGVRSKKYNLSFLYNLKSNKTLNTISSIEKNYREYENTTRLKGSVSYNVPLPNIKSISLAG